MIGVALYYHRQGFFAHGLYIKPFTKITDLDKLPIR